MENYLAGLSGLEKIYLICAVFGGGLFLLRTILMLFGVAHADTDMDAGHFDHGDGHFDDFDSGSHDVDAGLKLLTVQGLTAFIMMFGLTGFSISRSSAFGAILTIIMGLVVGFLGMLLVAKGFSMMRALQSSGNISIYDAIGEEGTVYLTIPAEGIGKIQIVVSGRLKVMDAVSHDRVAIKTGERISVAEITSGGLLSVRAV
jgi:hypothetical protein